MGDESLTGFSQQTDVQMSLRAASMAASKKNAVLIFQEYYYIFLWETWFTKKRILTWASKELKTKSKFMSHGSFEAKILFYVAR